MKKLVIASVVAAMIVTMAFSAMAASTTKQLSTNFTLVNLGSNEAQGSVMYYKDDGTEWRASETFTMTANGGQAIFRQYQSGPGYVEDGRGSVVVESGEPLGAVVQIQARGQDPTSNGAYSGITQGDGTFYVPLVMRRQTTGSGLANSQIIIQNTSDTADVDVTVDLVGTDGVVAFTKDISGLTAGTSYYYDLDEETDLPEPWYGSAVVKAAADGKVAVVSNLFTGDAMQTFNAFPSSAPGTTWMIPLFTSRLANGMSTPVALQNLSGAEIAAGAVTLDCTGASGDFADFSVSNATAIGNSASYFFNPVTDMTIAEKWYGSCILTAPANVVSFVQVRFVKTQGATREEAGAYEAIKAGGTDKTVLVPLATKRLGNGFATAITIQNMDTANSTTVDVTYIPSPAYVAGGGSAANIVIPDVPLAAGASLIHNLRITAGANSVAEVPEGWYGTMLVTSTDTAIHGFVQLTFLADINPNLAQGDNFMAHDVFTTP